VEHQLQEATHETQPTATILPHERKQGINNEVGSRIRTRRLGNGFTLKNVAGSTGLSVSLISQIELGKSAASISTLHKLSEALDVKMTYFFETI
jgi:ribosome-binding protein aMBF1 (putative translation factor)